MDVREEALLQESSSSMAFARKRARAYSKIVSIEPLQILYPPSMEQNNEEGTNVNTTPNIPQKPHDEKNAECQKSYSNKNLIASSIEWQEGSAFFTGPLPFLMESIKKYGSLAKTLASNINELYSMIGRAKDIFHEEETSDQFSNLIQNIWNKYTTKKGPEAQSSPSIISQDQHLFDELSFIEELDKVMRIAWVKCNGMKTNDFEKTPPDVRRSKSTTGKCTTYKMNATVEITSLSFELISQTPPYVRLSKSTRVKGTLSKTSDFETMPQMNIEDHQNTSIPKQAATLVEFFDIDSSIDDDGVHQLEEELVKQGSSKRIIENLSFYLCSPFMAANDNLFKKVVAQLKRMAEYAFVDGLHRELLYDDDLNVIYRNDMWSAGRNHILDNIIDAWAFLLNVENKRRSPSSINRYFFTTKPIVEQMKKLRVGYCGKIMEHRENKQHHVTNVQSRKWATHHKKL